MVGTPLHPQFWAGGKILQGNPLLRFRFGHQVGKEGRAAVFGPESLLNDWLQNLGPNFSDFR